MFKFAQNREVLYPVVIRQLDESGSGKRVEHEIKIRYRILTRQELRDLLAPDADAGQTEGLTDSERLKAALNRALDPERLRESDEMVISHVTGWEGIVDADTEEPIAFSSDVLRAMMASSTAFAAAVEQGLFEASREAPAKN